LLVAVVMGWDVCTTVLCSAKAVWGGPHRARGGVWPWPIQELQRGDGAGVPHYRAWPRRPSSSNRALARERGRHDRRDSATSSTGPSRSPRPKPPSAVFSRPPGRALDRAPPSRARSTNGSCLGSDSTWAARHRVCHRNRAPSKPCANAPGCAPSRHRCGTQTGLSSVTYAHESRRRRRFAVLACRFAVCDAPGLPPRFAFQHY